MKYIVTGGLGFIGSNFVGLLHEKTDATIGVIDKDGYASSIHNIPVEAAATGRVGYHIFDLNNIITYNSRHLDELMLEDIDTIFHFAAESHVDNSIAGPEIFVNSNVHGTLNLLEHAYKRGIKVVYISTDEVYGSLDKGTASFVETQLLEPNNVYSATKVAAEMLTRAYHKTHGMKMVITRCCNNYGPRQHTEKLLPKIITNAERNAPIPVYGDGTNVREWIHVRDHCEAIWHIHNHGKNGEIYNIGSGVEISNLELVKQVLLTMDRPESLIEFVEDRKGHDFRYSINFDKLKALGWAPAIDTRDKLLNEGLNETINWYISREQPWSDRV